MHFDAKVRRLHALLDIKMTEIYSSLFIYVYCDLLSIILLKILKGRNEKIHDSFVRKFHSNESEMEGFICIIALEFVKRALLLSFHFNELESKAIFCFNITNSIALTPMSEIFIKWNTQQPKWEQQIKGGARSLLKLKWDYLWC